MSTSESHKSFLLVLSAPLSRWLGVVGRAVEGCGGEAAFEVA